MVVYRGFRDFVGPYIERTGAPFTTWLWQATLMLPRNPRGRPGRARAGPPARAGPRRGRGRGVTVIAGALAGAEWLTTDAAYDYRIQSERIAAMHSVDGGCVGTCRVMQQASFDLQVRALGTGSALLLGSDVVLVGWVVALRGGRLDLGPPRSGGSASGGLPVGEGGRVGWRRHAEDHDGDVVAGLARLERQHVGQQRSGERPGRVVRAGG